MPNDNSLFGTNDDSLVYLISRHVCQTISLAYQQHPDWLREKFRNCAWETEDFQNKFVVALTKKLNPIRDRDRIIITLINLLQEIVFPNFFLSNEHADLIGKIRQYTHPETEGDSEKVDDSIATKSQEPISILLLDAENLPLDIEIENFLLEICNFPLNAKLAFANWRTLGDKDLDFHNRNYELIHVPAGKNNADRKMIDFGLSLYLHYPTAKEVFVCSSDRDLNPLCNTLLNYGLTVYRVSRKVDEIVVSDCKTGEDKIYSLVSPPVIPELDDFIGQLKQLIKGENSRIKRNWIKFSKISSLYQERFKLTIGQVVTHYFPEKTEKDFFNESRMNFVIHHVSQDSQLYVTLFDVLMNDSAESSAIAKSSTTEIDSQEELETAIHEIIQLLKAKTDRDYVGIGDVAARFNNKYKVPITKTIQCLTLEKNLVKFLSKCDRFTLKKVDDRYQVTID